MPSPPPPDEVEAFDDVVTEASGRGWRRFAKLIPLLVVAAGLVAVFVTGLNRYLSLDFLQARRAELQALVEAHPVQGLAAYMAAYVVLVAFSIPGAMIMTMAGGFLFGPWIGSAAAVTGATAGATIMFLVARSALGDILRKRSSGGLVSKIQAGVRTNAFSYLLVLRLIPAVPFWLVNIAAGFVPIRIPTYVVATVLGITPSTLIYTSIGAGLGHVFDRGETPDLSLVLDPRVMFPLLGLAALSMIPLAVHAWRVHRRRRDVAAGPAE